MNFYLCTNQFTMKNQLLFLFACSSILVLSACKSTSHTSVSSDVQGPTVIQKPVIADLDVSEKRVEGKASAKGSTLGEVKELAIYDALEKSNSDVLIEPRFDIEKSFNRIDVTVSGYPATYKNFRPMEIQDTIFVDRTKLNTTSIGQQTTRNNGRTKKILGIAGGSVAAAVGIFFLTIFLF